MTTENYVITKQVLPSVPDNVQSSSEAPHHDNIAASSSQDLSEPSQPLHLTGTQYIDEDMPTDAEPTLTLVTQVTTSSVTTQLSESHDQSLDPVLPDLFNVSGPKGPPISIQSEIDDLYNPLDDIVFSYGEFFQDAILYVFLAL